MKYLFPLLLLFLTACTASEPIKEENPQQVLTPSSIDTSSIKKEEDPLKSPSLKDNQEMKEAYYTILLHPEEHTQYYMLTDNIPSDDNIGKIADYNGEEPYYFAIQDIDLDGTEELLLGYGLTYNSPSILLNILGYDAKNTSIIDLDGERTYPLMDNLYFYTTGYYATQNGVSDLYTECWYLKEEDPNRYYYGWERGGPFYDFNAPENQEFSLQDFYNMVGDTGSSAQWNELTKENIEKVLNSY